MIRPPQMPYPNETIPSINPAAAALLKYIPLPNVLGRMEQNFYYATSAISDSDDLNIRLNRTLAPRPHVAAAVAGVVLAIT